jgi:glutathione peroxidase
MGSAFFKRGVDKFKFEIPSNLNEIAVKDIDGVDKKLGEYLKDKKAAIFVNVASSCGYTDSGYKQLMELYDQYEDKGLQILGFPCNQFMGQENKCELDIKNFAKNKFKVRFPMFSKIEVNGEQTHPVFVYLKYNTKDFNEKGNLKNIPWNFTKFLVDANGKVVNYYAPNDDPKNMANDINKLI